MYGLPTALLHHQLQQGRQEVSPSDGCIRATLFGFPSWAEEKAYQRRYVEDARNADKFVSALHVVINLAIAYAAVTTWTLPTQYAWGVAITAPAVNIAAFAISFLPDSPYRPLLRHASCAISRLQNIYTGVQADSGFVAAKFHLSNMGDFVHNLCTGSRLAPLLIFSLGQQMPISMHLPLQLTQALLFGFFSRQLCNHCSDFMRINFAGVVTTISRFASGFVLLNFQSPKEVDPDVACIIFTDLCIVLGVLVPSLVLWYNEVRHRASYCREQVLRQLRAEGETSSASLRHDPEPFLAFPALAIAALLPVTCLAWQAIILVETAAARASGRRG